MMQPVVIRLPDEERQLLELEAQKKGVPLAHVAREAISAHLKKTSKRETGTKVLLRWARHTEKYISYYKDKNLSTKYKEYLYGSKSKKYGYLLKKQA